MGSVASAAGYMTGGGNMAAVPALLMLTGALPAPRLADRLVRRHLRAGRVRRHPHQAPAHQHRAAARSPPAPPPRRRIALAARPQRGGGGSKSRLLGSRGAFGALLGFLVDATARWMPFNLPATLRAALHPRAASRSRKWTPGVRPQRAAHRRGRADELPHRLVDAAGRPPHLRRPRAGDGRPRRHPRGGATRPSSTGRCGRARRCWCRRACCRSPSSGGAWRGRSAALGGLFGVKRSGRGARTRWRPSSAPPAWFPLGFARAGPGRRVADGVPVPDSVVGRRARAAARGRHGRHRGARDGRDGHHAHQGAGPGDAAHLRRPAAGQPPRQHHERQRHRAAWACTRRTCSRT